MLFLEQPTELILLVIWFLDTRDVICLRMVCRQLQRITLEHVVWANLLRRQCRENHVPLCTYPIADLTSSQLERATMRPYAFVQKLLSSDPTCLQEHVLVHGARSMRNLSILPGGRYALSCDDQSTSISLHDMGQYVLSDTFHQPEPLSRFEFHHGPITKFQICAVPHSPDTFQICAITSTSHGKAHVVRVSLDRITHVEWSLLGSFSLPPATSAVSYMGRIYQAIKTDMIVLALSDVLIVYNFREHTLGRGSWTHRRITSLWADETHVVMLGGSGFPEVEAHVYLMPPRRPMTSPGPDVDPNIPAVHILSTPLPDTVYSLVARTTLLSTFNSLCSSTLDMDGKTLMLQLRGSGLGIYRAGPIQLAPNPHATPLDFTNFVLLARSDTFIPWLELRRAGPYPPTTVVVGEYAIEVFRGPNSEQIDVTVSRLHSTAAAMSHQTAVVPRLPRGVSEMSLRPKQLFVQAVDAWRGRIYFYTRGDGQLQDLHICDFVQSDV